MRRGLAVITPRHHVEPALPEQCLPKSLSWHLAWPLRILSASLYTSALALGSAVERLWQLVRACPASQPTIEASIYQPSQWACMMRSGWAARMWLAKPSPAAGVSVWVESFTPAHPCGASIHNTVVCTLSLTGKGSPHITGNHVRLHQIIHRITKLPTSRLLAYRLHRHSRHYACNTLSSRF
jgi:hypothetical protein